jgi:hypothetical protein
MRAITRLVGGLLAGLALALSFITIGPYGEVVRVWPAQTLYYLPY